MLSLSYAKVKYGELHLGIADPNAIWFTPNLSKARMTAQEMDENVFELLKKYDTDTY